MRQVVMDLGLVDMDLWSSPRLVGPFSWYLLPKWDGGTLQIQFKSTEPTSVSIGLALYLY